MKREHTRLTFIKNYLKIKTYIIFILITTKNLYPKDSLLTNLPNRF